MDEYEWLHYLHSVRVDTDGYRSVLHQPLSHRGLVLRQLHAPGDDGPHRRLLKLARLALAVVRVTRLGLQPAQLHDRLVRVLHLAAVAALVERVAVDELLLGQLEQLAAVDGPQAFDVARHGEGPAGAAEALVLDGRDRAVVSPVERLREGNVGDVSERKLGFGVLQLRTVAQEVFPELFFCT